MPSLNLRNVLRRNPDRPTLRERAAALKIAAGLVIRPPKSGAGTAAAPVEAGAILDRILIFRAQELVAIEASQDATLRATSYPDAYDSPDWVRMEGDREKILAQVIATRAHTMEGVRAKATLLDLGSVKHFQQPAERLAYSIAADVAALGVLPRPEQTGSQTAGHVDPHVTLLPALRQAFAWTREAHPFGDEPASSPKGRAHAAVMEHCWDLGRSIRNLPPPSTLAGLGALALALSVYAEEIIGRPEDDGMDDQRYPEERRLVAATRAMMSVAGVNPLPGWVGFEVGPDSDARWQAVKAQAGEGFLPAWALAGKSGPDDVTDA